MIKSSFNFQSQVIFQTNNSFHWKKILKKASNLIPNTQKVWNLTPSASPGCKIFDSTKCQTEEWLSISFPFPKENKKTKMDVSENEVIFTFSLPCRVYHIQMSRHLYFTNGPCERNSCNLHLEKTSFPIKKLHRVAGLEPRHVKWVVLTAPGGAGDTASAANV